MTATIETHEFQTEARQLLDLMIHSVYSNKDIFLRELISNASDAMDRRKFEAVTDPSILPDDIAMRVLLEADAEARTLTIHDDGIGMSRDEVIDLIGTIAKSGTKEFLKKVAEAKESASPDLIGQFGVGFYSAFMVADKVTLVSRRAGEDTATRWESAGEGTYTLEETERERVGTTITLHLKPSDDEDGMSDYTAEWTLRGIVKKYSDFVAYPIQMDIERTEVEKDEEGKPVEGAQEETVVTLETLNSMQALWLKDKSDVTAEELNEFYKHISHDWNAPLETISAKIEGTLEYRLLLFVPSQAPNDMFYREGNFGLHLYIKRVFIMEDCRDLMPEYLRFIKGVVDSEDLSLNVSREMLQQDRHIERMRKGIVSKVLDTIKGMRDDEDEYAKFWGEFGVVLKEGIYGDPDNRDTILELMRCVSTHDKEAMTTLEAYIERMKPEQEEIYYMTGESREAVENSPHLEAFVDKGYEVLILTDPVDEVWLQSVHAFKEKPLISVGKGAVDLGTEEEKNEEEESRKEKQKQFGSLFECLQNKLGDHVKEVRLSNRLKSSAACLVSDTGDMSPNLEKIMSQMGQAMPSSKRILELNPDHPVLEKLHMIYDADNAAPELDDYAQLLHGQALLAEGGQIPDPGAFSKLVANLMVKAI